MRVGFDVTSLAMSRTGVGTYTSNLLTALQQQDRFTIVPISHVPLNGSGRKPANRTWWMQTRLPRQLRKMDIDLCHFTNNVAPVRPSVPTIITLHDMTLWLYPAYHTFRGLLAARPIIPWAVRRANAIITVSESARTDIVRILGVPAEKIHVIYEAPAPEFRTLPAEESKEQLHAVYRLPERFILHVGTIEPRKNLTRLLHAFARLRAKHVIDHDLVVVGEAGWKNSDVYRTVSSLGLKQMVHFLGYLPLEHLVRVYNLAQAVAFPSLYEGFGLPAIEAMACGTPVVTSGRGSLREVAEDAAEFVDPSDVNSIAQGLQRVLTMPSYHAELSARGLAQAARFSWETAAEQTLGVYHSVLEQQMG
jgi:glycosyltransferase involved in cell wall biosynthesis